MGNPYTGQSSSGYNATPPSDDGSQTDANTVKWSTIKTKLTDVLKTFIEAVDSAITTAFGKIAFNDVTSTGSNYTVLSSDQGKVIRVTASATITTPAAATVGQPFMFVVRNEHSAAITIDGNGSETINGSATYSLPTGQAIVLMTDGTNWFTAGGFVPTGADAGEVYTVDQAYTAIASASQVNIGAAATGSINITGTSTILSFDTVAEGIARYVRFDGALTLTHNGTSLILPGGADITTASGDTAKFVSEGSGNWRCEWYQKASGSPITVAAGDIPSGSITQAKLSTTTGDLTDATTLTLQTGPGGEYGFWPTIKNSNTSAAGFVAAPASWEKADGTAGSNNIGTSLLQRFFTGTSGGTTLTVRQRYIQASPPYDLGDGEIPLFVFARVDAAGNIINTYVAPEPPWANNGPTNIRPDFEDRAGRKFRRRLVLPNIRAGLDGTKAKRAALEAALAEPKYEMVEITQAMKQADMPLIPHPWLGNDLTGQTIVLLDPVADMTHKLFTLHEQIAGANADESIGGLLHDGYMKIDSAALSRACPPGVRACAAKWK